MARTALGREVEAAIITGDTSPEALLGIQAQGLRLMHKPLDGGLLRQLVGIGLPAWPTTSNEVRPGSHFGNPGDDFVS